MLSIPILTSPDFGSGVSLFKFSGFKRSFCAYILLLIFFYANYYVLITKLYSKKKWITYSIVMIFCFLIISFLPSWLFSIKPDTIFPKVQIPDFGNSRGLIPEIGKMKPGFNFFQFRDTFIFQFLIAIILSLVLKLDNQLKEIKSDKLRAEVSYLKAQINPHFLFNTLNSIYALTITKSDKAPNAVLKLSDMMRYVVTESDNEKVPLQKEIQYISDYIALQKLRIGDNVDFVYKINGNPIGKQIAPIILINYVENAFKYGINPDVPSKIFIFIKIEEKSVYLEVKNDIVANKSSMPLNTEEGAKNTKQRLDMLYEGSYKLDIKETKDSYSVKLYLKLT